MSIFGYIQLKSLLRDIFHQNPYSNKLRGIQRVSWSCTNKPSAISQIIRVELYNSRLLFVYKIFFIITFIHVQLLFSSPSYIHLKSGPTTAKALMPSSLFAESQALLSSLLHINISLLIRPLLLYLL